MRSLILLFFMFSPAQALIGGQTGGHEHLVLLDKPTGYCSGVRLNTRFVLTAAHCVARGDSFSISGFEIRRVLVHPNYNAQNWQNGRVSVDLALIEVRGGDAIEALPLSGQIPMSGQRITLYGFGALSLGQTPSKRASTLVLNVTGAPSRLQIRLKGQGGGCVGDSGGPAFNVNYQLFGVISWSTGVKNLPCGDLTGISPLANHLEWVTKNMK